MWIQINIFYNRLRGLVRADIAEPRLARVCAPIKEACQAHTGITEGTFYRDEGWYFYELGRHLERADQTTRLLDVKYHLLLPRPEDVGSAIDVSQWNALLRSASAYHAFRRVQPRSMTAERVAGFMLFHAAFPRSVLGSVTAADRSLRDLRESYDLAAGDGVAEQLSGLRRNLARRDMEGALAGGLHEFLDKLQLDLMAVTAGLGEAFFGYESPASQTSSG
jgi:uncharacterized alpha-E superfamily protein